MASKLLSLNEVMDGLDGSDFEDDSDDNFDGYLDMDEEQRNEGESDEQRNEGEREEQGDEEESEEKIVPEVQDVVGANIEIAADGSLGPRDGFCRSSSCARIHPAAWMLDFCRWRKPTRFFLPTFH